MIILEKPNYPPYVCILCGLGTGSDRKWWVDLQFQLDNHFNPVQDGAIYLCNECYDSLIQDVGNMLETMNLTPVGEKPTYNLVAELKTEESYGSGIFNQDATGVDYRPTEDDSEPERDDNKVEPSVPDATSGSLTDFRGFFGGNRGS
ncbi:MAG: hypothetical protein H0V81_17675 [Solirubrobacterales bacterium]|nr:hypothetical protein [Solirubrobacterales bacterium]